MRDQLAVDVLQVIPRLRSLLGNTARCLRTAAGMERKEASLHFMDASPADGLALQVAIEEAEGSRRC